MDFAVKYWCVDIFAHIPCFIFDLAGPLDEWVQLVNEQNQRCKQITKLTQITMIYESI